MEDLLVVCNQLNLLVTSLPYPNDFTKLRVVIGKPINDKVVTIGTVEGSIVDNKLVLDRVIHSSDKKYSKYLTEIISKLENIEVNEEEV